MSLVTKATAAMLPDAALLQSGDENVLSTEQAVLLISVCFMLVGLALLYWYARGPISDARTYLSVESFDPHSTVDGASPVAVSGTVQEEEELAVGPVTGTECVAYEYTEKQLETETNRTTSSPTSTRSDDDGTARTTTWSLRDADRESVPFGVDTAHGTVAVDPNAAVLDLPTRATEKSSLLSRIAYRLPVVNILSRLASGRPKRTDESHLAPGDSVLVLGAVDTRETPAQTVAKVEGAGNSGLYQVTTRSRVRLAVRSLLGALLSTIPGLVFFLLGVGILAGAILTGVYS